MQDIICPGCKFKIPDRLLSRDVKYCPNCGLELEKVELECCGQWILKKDMEFCKVCPFCGRDYKNFLKEKERNRKRQEQKSNMEWKRTQEARYPPQLKGIAVKTRLTHCEYQGESNDILPVLYRDQERNNLIAEDISKEVDGSNNRIIILGDDIEQLRIISQILLKKDLKVKLCISGIDEEKMKIIQDKFTGGAILLVTPSEFMDLQLNHANKLFFASIFALEEPLIKQIRRLLQSQETPVIFDYLDKDKEGYFNTLYQGRIKLYEKHGAVLEKLEG